MKQYSFKNDYDSITYVIDNLAKNFNLSDWEQRFIHNIKVYNDGGGFLSEKQLQKLSDLWEKY